MSYHKKKLNDYEKKYFKKFFGTNVNRLLALRKSFKKRISSAWDYYNDCREKTGCQTVRKFKTKGGVEHTINLSKKSIDLYLESIGYNNDGTKK